MLGNASELSLDLSLIKQVVASGMAAIAVQAVAGLTFDGLYPSAIHFQGRG